MQRGQLEAGPAAGGGDAPSTSTFSAHRSLRVAVVPLGGIPEARFRAYLSLLQRFTELPMANLSKPGSWRKENSPFKHFSWFDGSLLLQYQDRSSFGSSADGAPVALQPPEWQDYQAHRRTWAVVGLVHIPSCTPAALRGIEAEFKARLAEFPHAVAAKVFCFGHSFGEGDSGTVNETLESSFKDKKDRLVIFPPEGDHVDTGLSMVELHMGVILNDVAVVVLLHLEEEVTKARAAAKKTMAKRGGQWLSGLRSPFDDDDAKKGAAAGSGAGTGGGIGSNTANPGRINKWIGDLCLLAGTPQDAIEAFTSAVADCKIAADPLWQAGALEGWIAALETMVQWRLPLDEVLGSGAARDLLSKQESGVVPKGAAKEIEDKANEALTLLEAQAPYALLAVELCFKMVRLHGAAKPSPRHVEALAYVMRAMAVAGLGLPQQVLRSLEAAALCRWLGLGRKFAFLLRLAAIQASELQSFAAAHALARVAAATYGARLLDEGGGGGSTPGGAAASGSASPPRRDVRSIYPPPPGGWPCIQKHLLSDLVAFAGAARDVTAACAYYLSLLHLCADLEGSRQRALMLLSAGAGGPSATSGGAGGGGAGASQYLLLSPSVGSGSVDAGQAPLSASAGRQKLLALNSVDYNNGEGLGGSRGGAAAPLSSASSAGQQHRRHWSEETEGGGGDGDSDEGYDDDGALDGAGGPLSSSDMWQIRGGIRARPAGGVGSGGSSGSSGGAPTAPASASSSSGGFSALKFSFKNRAGVLKPFQRGGSRGGSEGAGAGEGEGEDRPSSASSTGATAAVAAAGAGAGASGPTAATSLLAPNVAPTPEEQEALIVEMMRLTRRLPPRTPLDTHGLPAVHFVRPLRLPSDLVPIAAHRAGGGGDHGGHGAASSSSSSPRPASLASAAASSSAFIYNPFADKGSGKAQMVTWAAGEVAHVALALSNPLAAPLQVQSVELLVEAVADDGGNAAAPESSSSGSIAFCYPLTLWIPAYRRHYPLTLALKPLRPGRMVIKGVKMTVFNVTSVIPVDAEGTGPALASRSAPRDWYPRQALSYSKTPSKGAGAGSGKGGGGSGGQQQHHHMQQLLQQLQQQPVAVPTNQVAVVAPLPCLTAKLDRWTTNVELLPGEYRRASVELQVANEVPIGYLEISVHQKALTRKQKAAGRPVPLFIFESAPDGRDGAARCPQDAAFDDPHHLRHHLHHHESLSVAFDPLGLDALTDTLRAALRAQSCLSSLFLPLLVRRVDRFPEADIFVKYATAPGHAHHRTLTIPLRFHLKDGLAVTDLAVETARMGVYPALGRVVEAAHRGAWAETSTPLPSSGGGGRHHHQHARELIDTDHGECLLLVEVQNTAAEDLHIKTCLLEEETEAPPPAVSSGSGGSLSKSGSTGAAAAVAAASQTLSSELALLKDLAAPTAAVVRPQASRRIVVPFPRLDATSPLLQPPPPPPPPPGGGQAPKPTITLDSPEWTRALHGLCRSLRLHWADRHGLRSGMLRPQPALGATIRPVALDRLRMPLLRLSCTVAEGPEGEGQGLDEEPVPMRRRASTSVATFSIHPPLAFPTSSSLSAGGAGMAPPVVVPASPEKEAQRQQQQQQQKQQQQQQQQEEEEAEEDGPAATTTTTRERAFPPYAFIPVHFRVTNRSATETLPAAKCFCHTYQDYGNGNLNFAIDAVRAMWSGSLAWVTPPLKPGQSHLHVAYVAFTASGTYGVGLSASFLPEAHAAACPLVCVGHETLRLSITEGEGGGGSEAN